MNTLYQRSDVGRIYQARTEAFTAEGVAANLPPSSRDVRRTILVIVDMQVDFVHKDGALAVPGAEDDAARLIEFIYGKAGEITAIAASLDSHVPMQIFYPGWWKNPNGGGQPQPFTVISAEDLRLGKWVAVVDPKWSVDYVEKLEAAAKKQLMIWPYHTMIGTAGHSLVPPLSEAIAYHSGARLTQPTFLTKGTIPQVEHYGIMEPEVAYPKHPQGGTNTAFLDMIGRYDLIYVAGEAKSHCVLETMRQITRYFANQKEALGKIRFLTDCTSSVAHPTIDFETMANLELEKMEKAGVVMVKSTQPIG